MYSRISEYNILPRLFCESITTLILSGNLADNSQMPRNEQRHIVIAK